MAAASSFFGTLKTRSRSLRLGAVEEYMKQILQSLANGETVLAEVPCPARGSGDVLVGTRRSLVSLGTEKMLVDFGKGSLLAKARSQPDKVKQVVQKIQTDGLLTTIEAVRDKLDQPVPLGYCNVGTVLEADAGAGLEVGDRVISNGPHAEVVSVPKNLVSRIPEGVSDEQAAFTVVGAIGLQGIRLLSPTLGERVVVSGLGLIGLLCVQMLRANGCEVLGIDFDSSKLALARQFGAETIDLAAGEDPVARAESWTQGHGVDGVLITASTKSDDLIHQAATMCRKRGRIVLVGVVGLNLRRADFYEKELTFQVSCSYGPGRYDARYEQQGLDYPIGFVRWTEQRNFEAVLALMQAGRLETDALVSHRFAFDNAVDAYEVVGSGNALGIVLEYPEMTAAPETRWRSVSIGNRLSISSARGDRVAVAFIGAGNFTTGRLLPGLKKLPVTLQTVVSRTGVSGTHAAKKFGFATSSTDVDAAIGDPEVQAVFITTTHRSHASLVQKALRAGKHVFVEKPLALRFEELEEIREVLAPVFPSAAEERGSRTDCQSVVGAVPLLMVGFNRRFSPHTVQLKKWLAGIQHPKSIMITVNAGAIPADHWTQDPEIGGGRIIGEACHFIDLARHLAASPIVDSNSHFLGGYEGSLGDCASLQLNFEDGSIAAIHYLANGDKGFSKERVEVFAGGKVLVCDNFRRTYGYGVKGGVRTRSQDKGHNAELEAFVTAIRQGGAWPIPADELFEVSEVAIQLSKR